MADEEPRTSERALRRRYDKMGDQRLDAMRALARRDAALTILDETGTVTTEDVDRRVEATFNNPDAVTLANLLAQKAAAAVEFTRRELREEEDGLERTRAKRDQLQAHVEANEREIADAEERVAAGRRAVEEAEAMARFAGAKGNADAAPAGSNVSVDAATADTAAKGG